MKKLNINLSVANGQRAAGSISISTKRPKLQDQPISVYRFEKGQFKGLDIIANEYDPKTGKNDKETRNEVHADLSVLDHVIIEQITGYYKQGVPKEVFVILNKFDQIVTGDSADSLSIVRRANDPVTTDADEIAEANLTGKLNGVEVDELLANEDTKEDDKYEPTPNDIAKEVLKREGSVTIDGGQDSNYGYLTATMETITPEQVTPQERLDTIAAELNPNAVAVEPTLVEPSITEFHSTQQVEEQARHCVVKDEVLAKDVDNTPVFMPHVAPENLKDAAAAVVTKEQSLDDKVAEVTENLSDVNPSE